MKQSSLDDHESMGMDLGVVGGDNTDELELSEFDERRPAQASNETNHMYNNYQNRAQSPVPTPLPAPRGNVNFCSSVAITSVCFFDRSPVEAESPPERYRHVLRKRTFEIRRV